MVIIYYIPFIDYDINNLLIIILIIIRHLIVSINFNVASCYPYSESCNLFMYVISNNTYKANSRISIYILLFLLFCYF